MAERRHSYRLISLPDLAKSGAAEQVQMLPGSDVEAPAPLFGAADLARYDVGAAASDAGESRIRQEPTDDYVLHNAEVHGKYGVVNCGGTEVDDSTSHLPVHAIPGAAWREPRILELPGSQASQSLPSGYHLLGCNEHSYTHWLLNNLCRFDAAEFRGFGQMSHVAPAPRLLTAPLNNAWKQQSLDLLVPPRTSRLEVQDEQIIGVERLIYILHRSGAT